MANKLSEYVKDNHQQAIHEDQSLPVINQIKHFLSKHKQVYVEEKIDGERVFLVVNEERPVLATKHNGIYTGNELPRLFADIHMKPGAVIDCELQRKEQRLNCFDALYVDGKDIRRNPLSERKVCLSSSLANCGTNVRNLQYFCSSEPDEILRMFNEATTGGGEGLMLKDPSSSYGSRRTWLKLKAWVSVDAFVTGLVQNERDVSYSIAVHDAQGKLVPLGEVYSAVTGVDVSRIIVGTVLEVRHQPSAGFRALRHPIIMKIRADKMPEECLFDQLESK
jgi:ATP-dependent DNA ligase